jgi:hypothetical protein
MPSFSSKLVLTSAASSSGLIPLADIDLIKGAFKVYPDLGTLQNESVTFFTDKQVVMTGDTSRLYQTTITPPDFENTFEDSASFTEFSFTGLTADVPVGTISGSLQIAELGYLTSASAAAAGFGSGGGTTTDISALNTFTSSAQTSLTALNSATSSYALKTDISGAFTSVSSSVSTRLTTLEGTSGGDVTALNLFTGSAQTSLTALNSATSSYLTSASTGSFILASQTSSMSVLSALTASFISDTFISASAVRSGFGSGGGSINTDSFATTGSNTFKGEQIISSSLIVTNEIKGTNSIFLQPDVNDGRKLEIYNTAATDVHIKSNGGLTFLGDDTNYVLVDNSAAQTVSITGVNGVFVNSSLNVSGSLIVTGSINVPGSVINNLTSSFATTASFISDLFISASAVRSGFGTALFPSGLLSSSFQIANDISGAFTSLSSSFASRITALEGAGGGNGIFTLTGSFYSTTNNIQITGSLSVGSGSFKSFEVDSDGFVVLGDMDKDLNNAPVGTIAYSGSSFYLIT